MTEEENEQLENLIGYYGLASIAAVFFGYWHQSWLAGFFFIFFSAAAFRWKRL